MYNSLKYAKILESVGVPRKQAETHVHLMGDMMAANFASREDLAHIAGEMLRLRTDTQVEFKAVRAEMKAEFAAVRAEMTSEFAAVRAEMKTEFAAVRSEMASEFASIRAEMNYWFELMEQRIIQSEQRMVIKLGTIVSIAIGVAVTLAKLV
jgi:ethanolamine utilization cobalamin adenosyltransferase